jgi:hypothetical protein
LLLALTECNANLFGENVNTIKRNRETLLDSSKDVGLEVNAQEAKYVLMSYHHNAAKTTA